MGKVMRNASRGVRTVLLGKATIKAGECAVVFTLGGKARKIEGPKRVRMWCASIVFLDRKVATEFQFIEVRYVSGEVEHVPGPAAMYEDPTIHESVCVRDALKLQGGEAAVVYTKLKVRDACKPGVTTEGATTSAQNLFKVAIRAEVGPAVVVPKPDEWLHDFAWSWEGDVIDDDGDTSKQPKDKQLGKKPIKVRSGGNSKAALPTKRQPISVHLDAATASGEDVRVRVDAQYDVVDAAVAAATSPDPVAALRGALREGVTRALACMTIERAVAGGEPSDDNIFVHANKLAADLGLRLRLARWSPVRLPDALVKAACARREAQHREAEMDAALSLEAAASERREALVAAAHSAALKRLQAASDLETARIKSLSDAGVDVTKVLTSSAEASSRLLLLLHETTSLGVGGGHASSLAAASTDKSSISGFGNVKSSSCDEATTTSSKGDE